MQHFQVLKDCIRVEDFEVDAGEVRSDDRSYAEIAGRRIRTLYSMGLI